MRQIRQIINLAQFPYDGVDLSLKAHSLTGGGVDLRPPSKLFVWKNIDVPEAFDAHLDHRNEFGDGCFAFGHFLPPIGGTLP